MRWINQLAMHVRMLFSRRRAVTQLDSELQFHIDRQVQENLAAGMGREEARASALRAFGNPALLRDQAHETWSWSGPESLLRDLRYGIRTLFRTPGFAVIAVLVIALGIGANVALFTVVRSVLLKPLPYAEPGRLVRLYESSADGRWPFNQNAAGIYAEWKEQNHSFTDLAVIGYVPAGFNLSGDGGQLPESVRAATFSWNLLPLLGIQPALGRGFTVADDQPSANPTALLSWGLWKRRFGGDNAILNRTILLDDKPYTVVGVMPPWFDLPSPAIQLWVPTYYRESPDRMKTIDSHDFLAIGRLKPGVTVAQARSDLTVITRRIHDAHLDDSFVSIAANIKPLLEWLVGDLKTPLVVLLAATGCLLLIACLNVANLLVARTASRRRELAIRTAMGGGRLRLLRQHIIESLLLSIAGGAGGLLLALAALQWFITTRHDMARAESISIDWVVAAFALALVLLFAAFAGLISAFSMRGNLPLTALQESSRSHAGSNARTRLRAVLLTLEVALTVVLLIGSGLLIKSYARLRSTDLGCLTDNVLKLDINLPLVRYKGAPEVTNFLETLIARVRALPGVQSAGYIFPIVPGDGYGGDSGFDVVEQPPLPQGKMQLSINRWSDPGYFGSIGIPLLRGHTFSSSQQPGHATEVIVSQAFVRQFFAGQDPIGKHLRTLGDRTLEIVGVVGDTRGYLDEPFPPMMYFPLYAVDNMHGASLIVRSGRDVTSLALPIQQLVAQMDRDLPVSDILTMDQVIGRNTVDNSFDATLLTAFAALSLVLAAVGLFGVLSYVVAHRTAEIGIRMALGAPRAHLLRSFLMDGLRPAVIGLVIGLAAAAAVSRVMHGMLYQTEPVDPSVFAAVAAALMFVAALACLVPAWRSSRLDPMQALRTE